MKRSDDPPRLVSDRPKGEDFETLPRLTPRPRYRTRGLTPLAVREPQHRASPTALSLFLRYLWGR